MQSITHYLGRTALVIALIALLVQSSTSAVQPSHPALQAAQGPQDIPLSPPLPTSGSGCYVYPQTFHQSALEYVPGPPPSGHPAPVPLPNPYASVAEITATYQSSIFTVRRDLETGNFHFMNWDSTSIPSAASMFAAFSGAGTLGYNRFMESRTPANALLERGDWVISTPANTTSLAPAFARLRDTNTIMLLPLYDIRAGTGINMEYHVSKIAAVRLLGWNFAGTDRYFTFALAQPDAMYSCFRNTSRNTVGQITQFTATMPLTTGLSLSWNFGDGTSASGINTSHAYQLSGGYSVTLTTTDSSGFATIAVGSVAIDAAPTVDWTSSSPDQLGQTTVFTSTATGAGSLAYSWDFGDNRYLDGVVNPTHVYPASASYTAQLQVRDRNGFSVSRRHLVNVIAKNGTGCYVYPMTFHESYLAAVAGPPPNGHAAPVPLSSPHLAWQQVGVGYADSIFEVGRSTTSGPVRWLRWNGTGFSDSSAQFEQAFTGGGTLGNGFTETREPRNNLVEPGDWVAGSFGNTAILESLLTDLRNSNTMILIPVYDTVEGSGASTTFHITRLAAVRLLGWDFNNAPKTIKFALGQDNASYSCFRSSSPDSLGQTTQFTPTMPLTTGLTFNWDFGDGTTGSGINPTHRYAASGAYSVTLSTTDSSDFVTRAVANVVIEINPPTATFTSSGPDTLGQTTQFTSTATGVQPLLYSWDFGDGSPLATTANPSHTYTSTGTFLVTLRITDPGGASNTTTSAVTIVAAPTAAFTSSGPDTLGQTTQFTSTATGVQPLLYSWDFGDGSPLATTANPSHTYTSTGTFLVSLQVTDPNGASTTTTSAVTIVAAPTVTWTSSGTTLGQPTQFTSTATGAGPLSYDWDFGDGSAHATTANPSHTYTAPGSYLVRLVVTDANGVSASEQRTLTIESPVENYRVYLPQLINN